VAAAHAVTLQFITESLLEESITSLDIWIPRIEKLKPIINTIYQKLSKWLE
jgi:hypothetical protein